MRRWSATEAFHLRTFEEAGLALWVIRSTTLKESQKPEKIQKSFAKKHLKTPSKHVL